MRRAVAFVGLLGIVAAGISLATMPTARSASSEQRTFLIPGSDGYGVADCISSKAECGTVVANAWCEAQGFGKAIAFGVAAREDFTGSVAKPAAATDAPAQPLSITCGD